ncbi:MAG TPA: BON domain-containing protein [Thermoanaerobaculia bacterium]|nr:BON domain-containing protein [Thermoanaerobaculia bacterium]
MNKSKIQIVAVGAALALSAGLVSLTGCAREGEAPVVEAERNEAEGTTSIRVDGDEVNQRVDRVEENLDAAGEQVAAGAERVGEAAKEAGAALEESARKIEAEVGPVAREILDDASITTKVKARLAADPEVAAVHIDVDTIDGRVTLNGKVASEEQRQEAYKLAVRTEGVKEVVNLLQVAGQSSGSGR